MASDTSRNFPASYDLTTKIITAVVCAGMLAGAVASQKPWVAALLLSTICLGYAFSPKSYALSGRTLIVRRLIRNVELPLAGVRELRRAEPEDFRGCLRLWGSGGLFGYYGLFRTSRLGKCTWYVTDRSNAVVVVTETKTVLLSPDDPSTFMSALRTAAGVDPRPHRAGALIR
jgi:hypothetical protein